jgi:tRNA/rRNA methyltransferase
MHRVRVVLVRPQVAGNIGAIARLMENFDAGALYLVDPKADHRSREAMQRSTHGEHRLTEAHVVPTLTDALEGAVYAIGASRRRGPAHQHEDLLPRKMAGEVRDRIGDGDIALLFGTEDKGLSREDLLACDKVVQIPAQPEYGTLNLSHAAAICLYEVYLAVIGEQLNEPPTGKRSEPADVAMMNLLIGKLQHALLTIGYLRPEKPDHLMFPIRAILSRAELTRAEAQILMGLAQQIDEFAQYGK